MTITRSIAILCFYCFLFPHLMGQQGDSSTKVDNLTEANSLYMESVLADSLDGELEVPNVFTPNGDQVNDYFEVSTDGTTVYEFSVFTRTGTRIYHSLSPRIFWDGNSLDGIELKEGVYYYVIEEEGGSNPFEKAGFMHLFR
jgi:gliding motility-associated-like protein